MALTLSSSVFSGGAQDQISPESTTGHFSAGIGYGSYSGDDWALLLGYVNESFLFNLGFNHEGTTPVSGDKFTMTEVRGHVGLRSALTNKVFFDYGLLASYGFRSHTTATRVEPYEIGAFIGLSYSCLPHLLVGFKIAPYDYERVYNTQINHRFFNEGSVSASYLF